MCGNIRNMGFLHIYQAELLQDFLVRRFALTPFLHVGMLHLGPILYSVCILYFGHVIRQCDVTFTVMMIFSTCIWIKQCV